MEAVSVVIPLYNEENTILPTFTELTRELENAGLTFEIVYVDVGSRDRSFMISSRLAEHHPHVQALSLPSPYPRLTQAEALRLGADSARYEVVLFPGSSGQLPAFEIPNLLKALHANELDLICGARKGGMRSRLASQVSRYFLRRFFSLDLRDFCSPIRAVRKGRLSHFLPVKGFDRMLPLYFKLKGLSVSEVGVSTRIHKTASSPGPLWILPEIWRLRRQVQQQGLAFLEEIPGQN
ncbi:MAG: glycosyltransferase family 2 protein [Bdellovibrionaceae bacterium]|nr:glycosyltransferase family 2 protein [Bdellovibrionales bacterium]MCB9082729.1 glycosyltransferase family 2 protein [Pseudobdellovibrionaceae bacterium]